MYRDIAISVALLLALATIFRAVPEQVDASDYPLVGYSIISPVDGAWDWQLEQIRLIRPEVMKFIIPHSFRTRPVDVADVLRISTLDAVILRTADCDASYEELRESLVGRGYLDLIDKHPDIDWWVEVGNEPEYCTDDVAGHYRTALASVERLRAETQRPNLRWLISLPVSRASAQQLIGDPQVEAVFDGYATHVYAHRAFGDGGGTEWDGILSDLYAGTDLPIWITEAGINDPDMPDVEKAAAYVDWLATLRPQVHGVTFFVIAGNGRFDNYALDEQAHAIIGNRHRNCRYFPETGYQMCDEFLDYWQANGGLPIFGYPLTPERPNESGLMEQVTERSVFELHEHNPDPYRVLLRRLGAEYVDGIHPADW